MLRATGDTKTVIIHPHKMFSSRRKSLPESSSKLSAAPPLTSKKRRASNGFLNPGNVRRRAGWAAFRGRGR